MTASRSALRLEMGRAALAGGLVMGGLALLAFGGAGAAVALEEPPGEMANLKACEKRLCTMVLGRDPKGPDLKCDVQKTWAKSTLEGGKSKGVSWGFGDARCNANIALGRADIVGALTKPKHTIRIPAQQVNCVLERDGKIQPLTIKLAPKLVFKDGKADKVWINLGEIDGPADAKSTIWTAAKLEDSIGIFHGPMIKSINKFVNTQCAKRYGPGAEAKADAKEKAKTKAKVDAKAKQVPPPVKTGDAAAKTAPATPAAAAPVKPATPKVTTAPANRAPPKDKATAAAP